MKKKLLITFLCVFMVIPCVINAKTYYDAVSIVGNYMKNNTFVSSYEKYIHTQIDSFFYDEDSGFFQMGGLLSKKEFDITDIKYDNKGNIITGSSYLYSTTPFWTLTSDENNSESKYVVSSKESSWYDKNEEDYEKSIEIKATEYVKPEIRVSGAGTFSDPWYFNPKYKVSIQVNGDGAIKVGDEILSKEVFEFDDFSQKVSFILVSDPPNNYLGNTCPGIINDDGDDVLSISNVTSDATCIINFGKSQYHVVFHPGNCSGTVTGSTPALNNIEYDSQNEFNNGFSCQGSDFKEWNTKADGSGISFDDDTLYNGSILKDSGLSLENNYILNLYAQWENISSVVKLDQDNATTLSIPAWEEGFSVTYGNNVPTLTSIPRKEYTISFAGTNISPINYDYEFGGFYLDNVLYIASDGNGKQWNKSGGNFELKAKWIGNGFILPNAEQEGKTFEGWYDSASGGNKVGDAGDLYKPNKISNTPNSGRISYSLYPKFIDIKYNIVFNGGNCPSNLTEDMSDYNMYNIKYTSQVGLPANKFKCEGYTFNGWMYNNKDYFPDSSQVFGSLFNENPTGDFVVNLYAQWVKTETSLFEDFNDDDMNPGFSYSTSNFSRSENQYRPTNWSTNDKVANIGADIMEGTTTITFTPVHDGVLSFKYGEANGNAFNWGLDATLNGNQILHVGQWATGWGDSSDGTAKNGVVQNISVSAGVQYSLVLDASTYSCYDMKIYIDDLLVEYN